MVSSGIDINAFVTQLPIVAICLVVVWYFDSKNDKKDDRFQKFTERMQDDWQSWMDKQTERSEKVLEKMETVIGRHTETLNESTKANIQLIQMVERELIKKIGG